MRAPLYFILFQASKAIITKAGLIISQIKLTANAVTIFIGMLTIQILLQYSALAQCTIMRTAATKLHGVV